MDTHCEFLIVGAGMAGLALALQLQDAGKSTLVIDEFGIATGASGVPLGLINPAAARNANLSWNAVECIDGISRLLRRTSKQSDQPFYTKAGILRPASDSKSLDAYRKNFEQENYPAGWVRWMDDLAISTYNPDIKHAGGGLFVEEGYIVDMTAFLTALSRLLDSSIAGIITNTKIQSSVQTSDGSWLVALSNGTKLETNTIIHCIGSGIPNTVEWSWLPVHHIKGQIAKYRSTVALEWDYAIFGNGYLAHLNKCDWVVGSTYEHQFDHTEPDKAGLLSLEQKADAVLPDLRKNSTLIEQWAGIRLGTPNRLPIIGQHPLLSGQWVFTGLGSKGLMYAACLAELLAKALLGKADIVPIEIDVKRFKEYRKLLAKPNS